MAKAAKKKSTKRPRQSRWSVDIELPDVLPIFRRVSFLADEAKWIRDVLKKLKLDEAKGMQFDFVLQDEPGRTATLKLIAFADDIKSYGVDFIGHPRLVEAVREEVAAFHAAHDTRRRQAVKKAKTRQ